MNLPEMPALPELPAAEPIDLPPLDPPSFEPVVPPVETFELLKARKIASFSLAAQEASAPFLSQYPDIERATWSQQIVEAYRWLESPAGPFPMCEQINARRGLTIDEFMRRTAAKVVMFERIAALIVGERQRLEDAVNELVEDSPSSRAALDALSWTVTPEELVAATLGE